MTVAEHVGSEDRSVVESELDEPLWSVISFERVEALGLRHEEATRILSSLEDRGVSGLSIVTNDAALVSKLKDDLPKTLVRLQILVSRTNFADGKHPINIGSHFQALK